MTAWAKNTQNTDVRMLQKLFFAVKSPSTLSQIPKYKISIWNTDSEPKNCLTEMNLFWGIVNSLGAVKLFVLGILGGPAQNFEAASAWP